jgi:hypothetical protein
MRRAGVTTPDVAAAILAAFDILRANLSDADMARAINAGYAEQIAAQIISDAKWQAAWQPVRDTIRRSIVQSVTYYARNLPIPPSAAKDVSIAFDYLSPNVITAIRQLETRVITSLEEPARETLRAFVENGLRDGASPASMARNIRSVFGLAPSQAQEVANFKDALAGVNGRSIANYNLRNRTVDRLLAKGPMTPAQIDRYTELYRQKRIAQNAYVNARTAAVDAQRLANRLAWESAIDRGIVDGSRVTKRWVGVMDDRERPTHVAMENVTIPFDETWPVDGGALIPGDGAWSCRCVAVYRVAKAAA